LPSPLQRVVEFVCGGNPQGLPLRIDEGDTHSSSFREGFGDQLSVVLDLGVDVRPVSGIDDRHGEAHRRGPRNPRKLADRSRFIGLKSFSGDRPEEGRPTGVVHDLDLVHLTVTPP